MPNARHFASADILIIFIKFQLFYHVTWKGVRPRPSFFIDILMEIYIEDIRWYIKKSASCRHRKSPMRSAAYSIFSSKIRRHVLAGHADSVLASRNIIIIGFTILAATKVQLSLTRAHGAGGRDANTRRISCAKSMISELLLLYAFAWKHCGLLIFGSRSTLMSCQQPDDLPQLMADASEGWLKTLLPSS